MKIKGIEEILEVIKAMEEVERSMAEFYRTCAECCSEEQELFTQIASEEKLHEQYLQKIAEMVSTKPSEFMLNRPFNIPAIRTFISFIKETEGKIKGKTISEDRALYLAKDFEDSTLEQYFHQFVKSDDLAFQNLVREIINQTKEHRKKIDQEIIKLKGKGG